MGENNGIVIKKKHIIVGAIVILLLLVGALADMVVLDKDPTAVELMQIRDIRVLATIKEDIPIYQCQ